MIFSSKDMVLTNVAWMELTNTDTQTYEQMHEQTTWKHASGPQMGRGIKSVQFDLSSIKLRANCISLLTQRNYSTINAWNCIRQYQDTCILSNMALVALLCKKYYRYRTEKSFTHLKNTITVLNWSFNACICIYLYLKTALNFIKSLKRG